VTALDAYRHIVLAVDHHAPDERALRVAQALAERVGHWELLTVERPTSEQARGCLDQIASTLREIPPVCTILRAERVGEAIVDRLSSATTSLLVVGSSGRHVISSRPDRHTSRDVLSRTDQPTLVVGPHVGATSMANIGQLVICVDGPDPYPTTVNVVGRWTRTFTAAAPAFVVEVVATTTDVNGDGERHVDAWATELGRHDVAATRRVLHGGDPVEWLNEFADGLDDAIFLTTSRHYSDGRRHAHSHTAALVRRGRHPVLVVPAPRRNGASHP
jgi:nucleotide-binding universal stress UspA family protein